MDIYYRLSGTMQSTLYGFSPLTPQNEELDTVVSFSLQMMLGNLSVNAQ